MEDSLEHILSKLLKKELIAYIESNPKKVVEVIQLAKSNKPPHSSRAAYLLSKIITKNSIDIEQHVVQILDILPLVEDGQQRDLINVLNEITLSEEEEGILYDLCISFWSDLNKIPSIRFNAFRYILKTCKKYPELNNELILLTEDYYLDTLSQGIKKAILKRLQELKEKTKSNH